MQSERRLHTSAEEPRHDPAARSIRARSKRRKRPALGHALIDAGYRVLLLRTTDLVQQLQAARQDLKLAAAIEKLDHYHLLGSPLTRRTTWPSLPCSQALILPGRAPLIVVVALHCSSA